MTCGCVLTVGRVSADGSESWVAVSTVEYAEQHIAKHMPLKMAGTYVPQTKAQTDGIAAGAIP